MNPDSVEMSIDVQLYIIYYYILLHLTSGYTSWIYFFSWNSFFVHRCWTSWPKAPSRFSAEARPGGSEGGGLFHHAHDHLGEHPRALGERGQGWGGWAPRKVAVEPRERRDFWCFFLAELGENSRKLGWYMTHIWPWYLGGTGWSWGNKELGVSQFI